MGTAIGTDVGADAAADAGGGQALGLAREMGVAGGALDVGVAQQLADHAQALAGGESTRGIGVSEVVDAHVVETGVGTQAVPVGGDGGEVGAGFLADDDPWVVRHTGDPCQHRLCRGRKRDHARARLAVAQAKLAGGAVDIVPAQGQDLIEAAAGEHEEAQRRDGVGRDRALYAGLHLGLRLRERHTEPAVLVSGEEAFALLLLIFAHAPAGVGAVRHQAPGAGQGEHLGEDGERAVCSPWGLAQAVVERRHMRCLDHGKRHHAQRRQDVVLERAPVDACGMGVAVNCHVGAQVAGCEVAHRGAGLGRRCGGLLAPLDAIDGLGGAEPGLCRRKLAVGAERDAAEAAEETAAEMAEDAIEAAKMELHIDGPMKWVDIVDDDGNVTGMSSVDATTGMLTRGTVGVDRNVTGLLIGHDDTPTRRTAASEGQEFVQGAGVDGKTGELEYEQAIEAGAAEIGKVLDTSDDMHRLMLITGHQRDKTVRVFVDEAASGTNLQGVLVPAPTGTITARSLGMYYEATDRIVANDPLPTTGLPATRTTTPETLDAYDRVKVNDAMGNPAEGVELFELSGENDAGTPIPAGTVARVMTTSTTGTVTTITYQAVDIVANASKTDGGDADQNPDDLSPVTAKILAVADYEHIHFGVWAGLGDADKDDGSQDLAELGLGFVQNYDGSDVTDGSITGTATFNGDWAAAVRRKYASDAEKGAIMLDNGSATLTANFSEDEFTGVLTGLATLEGSLSGNVFKGDKATKITHPDLEATGTFKGSFSGAIYGDEGAEAAGVFSFDGTEAGAFVGAFGGRDRDQPVKQ